MRFPFCVLSGKKRVKTRPLNVIAQLPVSVATYLLNEKRDWIRHIEEREKIQVILIANPDYETPNYSIRRVRRDQTVLPENSGASYELVNAEDSIEEELSSKPTEVKIEVPAVTTTGPKSPPPLPAASVQQPSVQRPGLFVRLWAALFGTGQAPEQKKSKRSSASSRGTKTRKPDNRGTQGRRRDGRSRGPRDDRGRGGRSGQGRDSRSRDNRNRNEQNTTEKVQADNKPKQQADKQQTQKQPTGQEQ